MSVKPEEIKKEEKKDPAPPIVKEAAVPDPKIAELEKKVHALEIEKRVTAIHSKWPEFDNKSEDIQFLNGVEFAIANWKPKVEQHNNFADVTPQDKTRVARKPLEPIDEDAISSKAANL